MQDLSDRSRSESCSLQPWETDGPSIITGWLELENHKILINLINSALPLKKVFNDFKIEIGENFSPSGWSNFICCPFKDHNDKTPSFNFNLNLNRFNCFGCQKTGGPVQFISFFSERSIESVCLNLKNSLDLDEELVTQTYSLSKEIKTKLFSLSTIINNFLLKNPDALPYTTGIMWPIDAYIRNHFASNSIDLEHLDARIQICINKLNNYGDE